MTQTKIDDVKAAFVAEGFLRNAYAYKQKARYEPKYESQYIHQLRKYLTVKQKIESETLKDELSKLEEELLKW